MSVPYEVRTEHRDGVEIFTLARGTETIAEVAPGLGFNCFTFNDGPHQVFQNVPFETFLKKPTNYGLPILFPYPNRIRDGAFSFGGRTFKVNPNRHGYVRDRPWNVLDAGASLETGAFVTADFDAAEYPEAILEQFPFPFRIEVTYRLLDRAITMEVRVDNMGESPMPWGFGIHPYFNRTPTTTIQVPARKRFELIDALPTGKALELPAELNLTGERPIEGLTLDDIYTDLIDDSGVVRCRLGEPSTGHATVIEFDAATYPHVVVFTPPDGRPAVCIEPYTCPTDAFNLQAQGHEANIRPIKPGGGVNFSLKVASRS